jgi:hypothetical protein
MQARISVRRRNGLAVLGALLVVGGLGWLVVRELRLDPFAPIADAGWPFFVIIPGMILMLSSLIPKPPSGVGFAIAGSIVTTVGLVLLYQDKTADWESWAYAWALVGPGAAGLGMLLYGLIFDQRDLVSTGLRLAAIAAVIFVVGYWFFETIFATGRAPIDLGAWWPMAIIVAGLSVLTIGLASSGRGDAGNEHSSTPASGQGGTR